MDYPHGSLVRMVRPDGRGSHHGLREYVSDQELVRVVNPGVTNPYDSKLGFYLKGLLVKDWDRYVERGFSAQRMYDNCFYFYSTMVDAVSVIRPGDIKIRVVRRNGQSNEFSIPPLEYEAMDTWAIAERVFGKPTNVTGTKSLIDTPDATLMTVGIAE